MRPIDFKTVVVLDRSWEFGENDGSDFELRIKEGPKTRSLGTCQKTIWSWCLEGVLEMHRILTDVYPGGEQLLRFAAIDNVGRMLDTEWGEKMLSRNALIEIFKTIECPGSKEDEPIIKSGGLTMAIEALATETPLQKERHEKAKKAFEAKSEGKRFSEEVPKANFEDNEPRRASLVIYTRLMKDEEIEKLEEEIAQMLEAKNKIAEQPSNKIFRPITRLRIYFLNFYTSTETCEVTTRPLRVNEKHPIVKSYVISRKATEMPAAIHSLLVAGFQMASTTVAKIPMKEENRGSSNYDVELFHQKSSHNILMSIDGLDHFQINTKARATEGVTYETMQLTWATTPKYKWNLFPHHRQAFPCTPTEASRPSACLTQFVMGGRSVLLDLERKGALRKVPCNVAGKYLISHMLMVNSGRIFIHSIDIVHMFRKKPKHQIQRPIPIKNPAKNPNIQMLKYVFGQMRLDKFEKPLLAEGLVTKEHLKVCPMEVAKQRLKRITRNMPMYAEDTIVFQPVVKKHFEPLLSLITKWTMTDVDVENCNANIMKLLQKRDQRVPLVPPNAELKLACVKDMHDPAEQMRVGLIEMAKILANYAQSSENHRNIYNTFIETFGIDKLVKIEAEDVIEPLDSKMMKFDFSYLDEDSDDSDVEISDAEKNRIWMERMRRVGNPKYFEKLKERGEDIPVLRKVNEEYVKKKKANEEAKKEKEEIVLMKAMIGKPISIDLLDILCEKLETEVAKTRRDFVGREQQGNIAKLYPNLVTTGTNSRGTTPPGEDRKRTERGGSGTPPPAKFPRSRMDENDPNLLLRVDHVKYRKAGDGRSPIGRLSIYKEYVEWRDNESPEVLMVKFIHIKGQRVSPPHKSKVQLQLVLQNEEQATFVFMNRDQDKDALGKERDAVKETLQQALISHRAHVNQLAASVEKQSKSVELEAKQKILRENKHLEQLYKSLVATKLISPQDFWQDYYNQDGVTEDKIGINGAFLANIAQQEGTNGVRLNLNPEIIQAIFTTYPAVEKKHLELVPHEMTEPTFWSKFFQSHYFHREREVLPNPKDPFADCVKTDEEEMTKISAEGIARKRFDLDHLDDYALRDFIHKTESTAKSAKATLIKRCNYLSEKILATSWKEGEASSSTASQKKGFGVLDRVVAETENRLESEDLANESTVDDVQIVKIDDSAVTEWKKYPEDEARKYKSLVLRFFDKNSDESILRTDDMDFEELMNGNDVNVKNGSKIDETASMPEKWNLNSTELGELRDLHSAVRELCRHFWSCFPPINPDLETKLERMGETLKKFKTDNLLNSKHAANRINVRGKDHAVMERGIDNHGMCMLRDLNVAWLYNLIYCLTLHLFLTFFLYKFNNRMFVYRFVLASDVLCFSFL